MKNKIKNIYIERKRETEREREKRKKNNQRVTKIPR